MGAVNLELVGGATKPPATCMFCATNPVDEMKENKPPLPFIEAVGMDINWGETPYICWTCAGLIADLVDRPDAEKIKAVLRGAKLQKGHNEKLVKENEELRGLMKGLLEGAEVTERAKELMSNG